MQLLNKDADVDFFFGSLAMADQTVLFLDFDGTLAPFCVDPEQAIMYPGMIVLLDKIIQETPTRIVIVSGRALDSLQHHVTLSDLPELWGNHGAERLFQKQKRDVRLSKSNVEGLQKGLEAILAKFPNAHHESKPYSVAFHWRGEPEDFKVILEKFIRDAWSPLLDSHALKITPFKEGIELRPNHIHKGVAVDTVLQDYIEGTVPVAYLGDDYTDEDGFQTLGERGLKCLVGSQPRPTVADVLLHPPEDVFAFLSRWYECSIKVMT